MNKKNYFQKKIFTYYSLIIIITLLISFGLFYSYTYHSTKKTAINNLTNVASITCDQLDTLFKDMDKMALQVIANPTIVDYLMKAKKSPSEKNYFIEEINPRSEVVTTLTSINGPNIFAKRISIYDNLGNYVNMGVFPDSYNYIQNQMQQPSFQENYEQTLSYNGKRSLSVPRSDNWSSNRDNILFSLVREIRDLNFSYGVVEIQLPIKEIANICTSYQPDSSLRTYLLSDDGQLVHPYPKYYSGAKHQLVTYYLDAIKDQEQGFMKVKNPITGANEIVAYDTSQLSGWKLLYVQSINDLTAPLRVMGLLLIGIACMFILASLLLIFYITSRLTRPLKDLRKSINEVDLKNLSIDTSDTHYNSELKLLNDSFIQMFQRLESSMDEVVSLRTNEMKAHVLALQSQMNPHFLYNTLAVINGAAIENDYIKICGMCQKLSTMLRYTTHFSEGLVTLEDEMKNVQNYLDLMKDRYEDKLTYTIESPSHSFNINVPKLILQPLIENCFSHGFKDKRPPWFLHISAKITDTHWYLQVKDNGTGFDLDRLEELHDGLNNFYNSSTHDLKDLQIGGLALLNTLIRLKFIYKDDMLFDVITDHETGTEIIIGGPLDD